MKRSEIKSLIFTILPFLIASLIMLPRLLSPQFGFLDDGRMLVNVRDFLQGDLLMDFDQQTGRFRPFYWLFSVIIYQLGGANPFWFFIAFFIILILLLLEIRILMRMNQAEGWQIFISSIFFIFSIPIIENFYTLSKGEPFQLVFLLGAVIILHHLLNSGNFTEKWSLIVMSLFILFALLFKETAITMAGISLVWISYIFLTKKHHSKEIVRSFTIFLGSCLLAIAIFFFLRYLRGSPSFADGAYTSRYTFSLNSVIEQGLRWLPLFAHYYHYIIPLSILGLYLFNWNKFNNNKDKLNLFIWSSWSVIWVLALIPWGFAEAYYLLPLSLGLSMLIGLASPNLIALLEASNFGRKVIIIGLSFITAFLFFVTLSHYRTHSLTQLMIDEMNDKALSSAVLHVPSNGRLFISLEERKEYVDIIEHFIIYYYERPDISYENIDTKILETLHWHSGGIVMMPYIENKPRMLVRLGVDEEFTTIWNNIVLRNRGNSLILLESVRDSFQVININLPVIACPIIGKRGFCENPDPIIDIRIFEYGWEIYQIQ